MDECLADGGLVFAMKTTLRYRRGCSPGREFAKNTITTLHEVDVDGNRSGAPRCGRAKRKAPPKPVKRSTMRPSASKAIQMGIQLIFLSHGNG
jgi:hypothetical protein